MRAHNLQIIPTDLWGSYIERLPKALQNAFDALQDAEISTDTFSFYTSVSAVFSSKIEGETIELDSYIKHRKFGIEFLPDYTQKIDDLYNAYSFAKTNVCQQDTLMEAHRLLSKHLVATNW